MNLTFHTDFWDQPKLRTELIRFINQIHNLDLTLWERLGFWDRNYQPLAYFVGDRMVANACLYTMNMRVAGKDCKVAQISAVGTDPDYRLKGLAYDLDQQAMEWAKKDHDFFYLFADTEAFRLYEKCGFRRVVEHKSRIRVEGGDRSSGLRKLDPGNSNDRELIYRIARERTPVSNRFGVNNPKLFMFWCLYFLKENIYYVEEFDLLVLFERKDDLATILDIVGKAMPQFSAVYPFIAAPTDRQVEFSFMPDRLNIGEYESISLGLETGTHLYGEFELEDNFIIPMTAKA